MTENKVARFYQENKEDIELVKEHGDLTARAIARAIERLAKENMEEES